jgi:hypothetical protein
MNMSSAPDPNAESNKTVVDFDGRDAYDQDYLAEISLKSVDVNVRREAVENLTDQALLAKVAINSLDWCVRLTAVENLTDQDMLAKVAVEAEDDYRRREAVEKLTDQAMLAKVANEAKEADARLNALEKLTDQSILASFANDAEDLEIRRVAVRNITDQAMLARLAVEDEDAKVRLQATWNLTDRATLAKVARDAKDMDVRGSVEEKLAEQAILEKAAIKAKNEYDHRTVVDKLTDQAQLAMFTIENENEYASLYALEKLTAQDMLAKVANEAKEADARLYALEKLTDQSMLAEVAIEAREADVRRVAVWKLTDQDILSQVASTANAAKEHEDYSELSALIWLASFARDQKISYSKLCGAFDEDKNALGILLRARIDKRPAIRSNLDWLKKYFPDAVEWFPERTGLRINFVRQQNDYFKEGINHTGTLRVAYCHDYVPKNMHLNDHNSERVLEMKRGNPTCIDYYANAIKGMLNEGALLCCAPSSSKDRWSPGLIQLVAKLEVMAGCAGETRLIRRTVDTEKRSTGGDRSIETNLNSIACSFPQSVTDRDVVVLDDIVTTGNTFLACAEILWRTGAGSISGIALGRTQNS